CRRRIPCFPRQRQVGPLPLLLPLRHQSVCSAIGDGLRLSLCVRLASRRFARLPPPAARSRLRKRSPGFPNASFCSHRELESSALPAACSGFPTSLFRSAPTKCTPLQQRISVTRISASSHLAAICRNLLWSGSVSANPLIDSTQHPESTSSAV